MNKSLIFLNITKEDTEIWYWTFNFVSYLKTVWSAHLQKSDIEHLILYPT